MLLDDSRSEQARILLHFQLPPAETEWMEVTCVLATRMQQQQQRTALQHVLDLGSSAGTLARAAAGCTSQALCALPPCPHQRFSFWNAWRSMRNTCFVGSSIVIAVFATRHMACMLGAAHFPSKPLTLAASRNALNPAALHPCHCASTHPPELGIAQVIFLARHVNAALSPHACAGASGCPQ